ncbi:hypothetical protein BHU72_01920 [Desulfuribacillus stibiiarsenatis]|uniref:Abasic site processing protein n=1 Tax=Desulfuribacillus stibiiarsenatis TaxID=1390249 RepID=A0A1E5L624_9FIRM|nr:SOS response-associated peptidase [Desulfuribacillus stibiiarsenatis]OEH85580.1 hypothetical protein BHU72_01920 [Desulfuribacillus stibiiarsenatis]
MCGRFVLTTEEFITLATRFMIENTLNDYAPSYNIAPTQNALVIISQDGKNIASSFKWGLIPQWAKDMSMGAKMINARAETIDEKPSYKKVFFSRRCLVPTSGFYEWRTEGKSKIPYRIYLKETDVFSFAGIWETWLNQNNQPINTFSIITSEANEIVKPVHDRMPVILTPEQENDWLHQLNIDKDYLKSFLKPYDSNKMDIYHVSALVNSPKNNIKELLNRIS